MNQDDLKKRAWDDSYNRCENHVYLPCDEIVRFISRYLRRRVGLNEFVDIFPGAGGSRIVDVGCGIGRNLIFGTQMGFKMYGNDLSVNAVEKAQEWLMKKDGPDAKSRVVAIDILNLPWEDKFFDHAISDSALDSMHFEIAQEGISEVARVVRPGGYFYCSLISGDQTGFDPDFCDQEIVATEHEKSTFQSYFNKTKIRRLVEPLFEILSCQLHQIIDPSKNTHSGRWHVISRRRQL